ncbi:major facilitator superfamily MFS_1 [Methylocella silvestris BL2]|uniref:Major facilitator superfamily MFS_1 n=1 Tax=Methylocella silvestris (strain DSM 15510 / CIP 108128 / LMG 27833 / NCIMB 13906 / BL2) TaxID=395965 RepID=B8EMP6_METSB|nr:MFS transporter [Methylocella silvestris]ACK52725.1 major facilitator superfamily MFS_1 [Methylocella silvestris BL2]
MLNQPRRSSSGRAGGPFAAIACAVATVAIVGVGLSLTMTLIAVRLGEQGFSARAIGINTAAAGFATLASASFIPDLARRFGVGRLLFAALILCVLCLAAMAIRDDYWLWLGLRALFGVGLTVLFVLSEYWINAVAPPERRGAILGFYAASVALGFAAGPLILACVGTVGSAPFLIAMALFAAAALPIVIGSKSAPAIETHSATPVLAFLLVAPVATLAGLLHGAIETASMGLLPVFALRSGLGAETGAWFVTLFALGNVAFQFPVGFLADMIERRRLLMMIALVSLIGAIALSALEPSASLLFGALLLIWGGVAGSFYAVALGYLGARYKGPELASANAAFVMLYSGGMLGGPPIMGAGMDALGPHGFFLAIAALLAIYLLIARLAGPREGSAKPRS